MNIFATDISPEISAQVLPDKHVVKMILESCQMLSIVYSPHYWDCGEVMKVDGTPFKTERGAFKNHPCTAWVAAAPEHCAWLLRHALEMCREYTRRYDKQHGLQTSVEAAAELFKTATCEVLGIADMVNKFARAMPDELKLDTSISDCEAYRRYLCTKPWIFDNYLRAPERKPAWLLPTPEFGVQVTPV